MEEKRKHKGLTRRVNAAGKGYFDNGEYGIRTRDLRLARAALSQLSYIPLPKNPFCHGPG